MNRRDRSKSVATPRRVKRQSRLSLADRERWETVLERKMLTDAVQQSRKEVLTIGERTGTSKLLKRGGSTAKEASIKDAAFHREHVARGST